MPGGEIFSRWLPSVGANSTFTFFVVYILYFTLCTLDCVVLVIEPMPAIEAMTICGYTINVLGTRWVPKLI